MYVIILLLFKRYHTCNGARVDYAKCFGRVLGPFSKENPKIVKPRKSWVVLQPSFRFSHLQVYSAWARADAGKGGRGMMGID